MTQRIATLFGTALIAATLSPFAGAAEPAALVVPSALQAPATQKMSLETSAVGVQIYLCSANKTDASKFEWSFKAPEADLFDGAGVKVGKHYAGPTWESNDGSKVVGDVKARSDAPGGNAIPWLLLAAKSNAGNGVFGKVMSVQRVATEAGKAPVDGCGQAELGKEIRVPYKALYRFFSVQ